MAKPNTSAARAVVQAAGRADRTALAALHAQGADLNAVWRGYRALHALIQEDPHAEGASAPEERLPCLVWLLEHGADPELPGAWPPSRALLVAAFSGETRYVEALRDHGARSDFFTRCALGELAAVRKELARSKELARARDGGTLTALQCVCASRMGRKDENLAQRLLEIAALLLDAGAQPGALTKSWSHEVDAAYFACNSGQKEMLELLLERGADATAALPSAAWRKTLELAELCLAHGAKIDEARAEGRALLNELVRWGQVTPVLWLLEKRANPNLPDERGWTAVHQAASRGNERMMRAILAAGGDLGVKDKQGLTPLSVALLARKPKMLELLGTGGPTHLG
ncbi:MAG: ankyrin repeat domain-containing protein [Planctomycetes bacterium]|nr:ankyrin repeat domain-containing protein [Planctomycetota bacterium]